MTPTAQPSSPVKPSTMQGPEARIKLYTDKQEPEKDSPVQVIATAEPSLPTASELPTVDFAGISVPIPPREERLAMALMGLVSRLDEMSTHASFKAVFKAAGVMKVKYEGPTWAEPLMVAKSVLESK